MVWLILTIVVLLGAGVFAFRILKKTEKDPTVYGYLEAANDARNVLEVSGVEAYIMSNYLAEYSKELSWEVFSGLCSLQGFFESLKTRVESIEIISHCTERAHGYSTHFGDHAGIILARFSIGCKVLQNGKWVYLLLEGFHAREQFFNTVRETLLRDEFIEGEFGKEPSIGVISEIKIFAPEQGHDLKKKRIRELYYQFRITSKLPKRMPQYFSLRGDKPSNAHLKNVKLKGDPNRINLEFVYNPIEFQDGMMPMEQFAVAMLKLIRKGCNFLFYGKHLTGKSSLLDWITENVNTHEVVENLPTVKVIRLQHIQQFPLVPGIIEDLIQESGADETLHFLVRMDEADPILKGPEKTADIACLTEMLTGLFPKQVSFILSTNLELSDIQESVRANHRIPFQLSFENLPVSKFQKLAEEVSSTLHKDKKMNFEKLNAYIQDGKTAAGYVFSCIEEDDPSVLWKKDLSNVVATSEEVAELTLPPSVTDTDYSNNSDNQIAQNILRNTDGDSAVEEDSEESDTSTTTRSGRRRPFPPRPGRKTTF